MIRVKEVEQNALVMIHGVTIHGIQYQDDLRKPTAYYIEDSGVGLLLLNHPKRGNGARVALLGLGVGTLVTYGEPSDTYRLYVINQIVIDLAQGEGNYFTFLKDSKATIEMIPGDARISLENEWIANGSQNFDVIVLDTFSSDSIPVHLVTKEAYELYLQHLTADGVIAANISNRSIDLQPVFWKLAQEFGLTILRVDNIPDEDEYLSTWILMSQNPASLEIPEIQSRAQKFENYSTDVPLWTDDYSNLFQILR